MAYQTTNYAGQTKCRKAATSATWGHTVHAGRLKLDEAGWPWEKHWVPWTGSQWRGLGLKHVPDSCLKVRLNLHIPKTLWSTGKEKTISL